MITGSESDGDSPGSTQDPTPSQDAPVDDTESSETKAASTSSPAKNLTLAEGKARAQTAKAASSKRADEGAAATKKRAAPDSPCRESISNDLDVQQDQADQQQGATEVFSFACSTPVYSRGYYPPDAGSGSPMFLEHISAPRGLNHGRTSRGAYVRASVQDEPRFVNDIEAARCVLLAPHRIPLNEFISLRKKPEAVNSEKDHLLSYVLDQRDLRIEFAHLIAKWQLHSVMEGLDSSLSPALKTSAGTVPSIREPYTVRRLRNRGLLTPRLLLIPHLNNLRAVNPGQVFRLPRVLRRGITSPLHKQLALPRAPPLSDDPLHMEVQLA
ncbi:ATP-binding cassette (ABC) Superfamily, partial [Phytophthora palmivora]